MKLIDTNIAKCKNWNEFYKLTSVQRTSTEQGDYFERFTQLFLQTSPIYRTQFKNIWWNKKNELPESVRQELNMPRGDEGIDLIAETREGEYCSIQAKFRTDTDRVFTSSDLDRFSKLSFAICKNISSGLFLNTSKKPIKKSDQLGDVKEIGLQDFLDIDKAQWKNIINICNGNKLEAPKPRTPNPKHQTKAIDDSYDYFFKKKNKRGKLIMPCGTGKTLTAFWIAEKLKSKTIIVSVPSIALVKQTLKDWAIEFTSKKIVPKWIAVCSDESVGEMKKMDTIVASIYESGIPTTTKPRIIERFIKTDPNTQKIIFTTYHSSPLLAKIIKKLNIEIDLLIADEAHKTAGEKAKVFSTLLYDENIKIKKRLFMTATKRVCKDKSDDIVSMDDVEVYGKTYHRLSFKEAIKKKLICDYKIITINIPEEEIEKFQEKLNLNTKGGNVQYNSLNRNFLSHIALEKSFKKHNVRHAISFHQSISKAEDFKDLQNTFSGKVFPEINISAFHVSSKKNASERQNILSGFIKEKYSLITNARCLTEGVDIPAIDCVVFSDPKQSTVDIVQACGRAMRNHKHKKFGYIILPISIPKDKSLEEFNKSQEFKTVRKIITALSTQDERIAEYFKKSEKKQKSDGDIVTFDSIDTINFDYETLKRNFYIKTWESVGQANWRPFEEARNFVHNLKLTSQKTYREYIKSKQRPYDIPTNPHTIYKNQGWISYGDWLGTGIIANQYIKFLEFKKARKFCRNLKLKKVSDWTNYIKSKPDNIPSHPHRHYKESGWISYYDWLGLEEKEPFLDFKSARQFVHTLKLKSNSEWRAYSKSEKRPANIPGAPEKIYKNKGWISYGDWLGTGTIAPQLFKYRKFKLARSFVQSLNLKNEAEWREYYKSKKKPKDIPSSPDTVYKNKGWISYGDWLGTKIIANRYKKNLLKTFSEAKKFVHKLKLETQNEWRAFSKTSQRPEDIPSEPDKSYSEYWVSWEDWIGKTFRGRYKNFLSYEESKKIVQSYKFKSVREWKAFRKSNEENFKNIPSDPARNYSNTGWISYNEWLGLETYLNFKSARQFAHTLKLKSNTEWRVYCKSGKRPVNIPGAPDKKYKNRGWVSWYDWLGNKN